MEVREIKALVVLMNDYGLVELEIEDKKGKVRLVRAATPAEGASATPSAAAPARAPTTASSTAPSRPAPAAPRSGGPIAAPIELAPNQVLAESPMVGTFYRAASPDSEPFVHEGDSVRKGQTICIIEAMKMMNEVEAPAAGRVVRIITDNGQAIEYGQPLMIIEAG
ncbi:MAG: acetyl-CoA carboxylase biotin carboxyl carrier protein [Candidatus Binataceae bacterium]